MMDINVYDYLYDKGFEKEDGSYLPHNDKKEAIEDIITTWANQNSTAYDITSELVCILDGHEVSCISLACADECGGVYSYLFTVCD
jgi:hypothetical protein